MMVPVWQHIPVNTGLCFQCLATHGIEATVR